MRRSEKYLDVPDIRGTRCAPRRRWPPRGRRRPLWKLQQGDSERVLGCWLPSFGEWVETLKLDRLSAVIANVLLCSFYPVIKNNLYTLYRTTHGWRGRARRRWCPPRWCSSTGGCGTATGTPRYLHTTCHVSRYCHVCHASHRSSPRGPRGSCGRCRACRASPDPPTGP